MRRVAMGIRAREARLETAVRSMDGVAVRVRTVELGVKVGLELAREESVLFGDDRDG